MMVFNKRKRKGEENERNWEGRKIEQVNEFLAYTFNERATDKAHIREIVRKANKEVGCVWGLGERKWGGDYKRMMMFESLIECIDVRGRDLGMKGIRIGREGAKKYLRGVLGEDTETPDYIVKKAGKKATKFEGKCVGY
jgi:hypothetical protein